MRQPLLSILIPTVVGRENQHKKIFKKIKNGKAWKEINMKYYDCEWHCAERLDGVIQIMSCRDDKTVTIGQKREWLYKECTGLFAWQIDDDDDISDNAIELIFEAIKQNPDCITSEEYVNIDGKEYKSNHSLYYHDWEGEGHVEFSDGFHFHRTPFFKSVIKTEIARSVPIPHIRFGEDHQWAQALKQHLKTEVHIPEQIYSYIHVSSNHVERYGLDK